MKKQNTNFSKGICFGDALLEFFSQRHASTHAAFFISKLKPGMKVLDCGCGPGSITLDLAELVSQGKAIGIDIESRHIDWAKRLQRDRKIQNVEFRVADLNDLPFDDGTFDAAFAHGVVEYFKDPVHAFGEIRRVLKDKGVFGARHGDWGGFLFATKNEYAKKAMSIFVKMVKKNGGNPQFGRYQSAYLRMAGFSKVESSASYDCWTPTLEEARRVGEFMRAYFTSKEFVIPALKYKFVDKKTLPKVQSAFDDWGIDENVFAAEAWGEAVAWKS
jgi:ubiquinone/menaquinone biosynthesis C-methylase UbiE